MYYTYIVFGCFSLGRRGLDNSHHDPQAGVVHRWFRWQDVLTSFSAVSVQGILQNYKHYLLPAGFCLEDNCVVERHVYCMYLSLCWELKAVPLIFILYILRVIDNVFVEIQQSCFKVIQRNTNDCNCHTDQFDNW